MSKHFEVLLSTRVTVLVELGEGGTPAAAAAVAVDHLVGSGDGWDWEADDITDLNDDADEVICACARADLIVSKS
jgi:hypothetical protein